MRLFNSAFAAFALAASLLTAPAQAAHLVGHYADYQVDIRNLPPGGKGDGTWQMGFVATCKNWKVSQIVNFNLQGNGQSASIVIVEQGDESNDGLSGNYTAQISANGQQTQIKQSVVFAGKNQPGKASITVGQAANNQDIPAGTVLMWSGTQSFIDQLAAGKTDFTVKIIEPTSETGYEEVRVELLANSPFGNTPLPADPNGLLKGKSWLIKTTHRSGSGDSQEVMMQVHESGVTSRIMAALFGVQFEMTLRNVTVFPKPAC